MSEQPAKVTSAINASPVEMPGPVILRNILVGTDFSPASELALTYALAIARRYESHVYVVHAIRPELYTLTPPEASGGMVELVRQAAQQEMANLLISGRLREVPHQAVIEQGDVWQVISDLTAKQDADLIVIGTHGRTGFERMFLGSVAERVFRLSAKPVLTVGPSVGKLPPAEVELKRIVYATDFSPASRRGLPYAVSLAQEHQAALTLLHVVENVDELTNEAMTHLGEYFTEQLQNLLPPGCDLWCYPEFVVSFGSPTEKILELTTEKKADLLVLGIRGGGAILGHLPPAKAYRIVCDSPCPVLTVRQ